MLDFKPALTSKKRVGTHARRQNDQVGGQFGTVFELHGADGFIAIDLFDARVGDDVNAELLQMVLEHLAGGLRKLSRQEPAKAFEHRHLTAPFPKRSRGLQAKQSTADANTSTSRPRQSRQGFGIRKRAERMHPLSRYASYGRHKRMRTNRENEAIIGKTPVIAKEDLPTLTIDGRAIAVDEFDMVFFEPRFGIKGKVVFGDFVGEKTREVQAVIGQSLFFCHQGDLHIRVPGHLDGGSKSGQAGSDDDDSGALGG